MSAKDFRRYPRVRPDPRVPIRVDIMGKGFLDVLHATDISVGGLGISVPHAFSAGEIGEEVELIITLGRARPFKARGKLRHRSDERSMQVFGIEFVGLSAEQLALIEGYVASRLKRVLGA